MQTINVFDIEVGKPLSDVKIIMNPGAPLKLRLGGDFRATLLAR
jgi:hypothetical protein